MSGLGDIPDTETPFWSDSPSIQGLGRDSASIF